MNKHYAISQLNAEYDVVIEQLLEVALKHGFSDSDAFKIRVCIAEIFNNIIQYATKEPGMLLETTAAFGEFNIKVTSTGPNYNLAEEFQQNLLTTSGRGLVIVAHWCDSFCYQHDMGVNKLLLKFTPQ